MMSEPTRRYALGGLTVEWRSELCIHCGNCHDGLPEVFDPKRRPWVDLSKGDPGEIFEQLQACPSGALSVPIPEISLDEIAQEISERGKKTDFPDKPF